MRVQFQITDEEYAELSKRAEAEGYPSISAYCRDCCFARKTERQGWDAVKQKIADMEPGTGFFLRDLVGNAAGSGLGRRLYAEQEALGIYVKYAPGGVNYYVKK